MWLALSFLEIYILIGLLIMLRMEYVLYKNWADIKEVNSDITWVHVLAILILTVIAWPFILPEIS